jgi:hypothetical protein
VLRKSKEGKRLDALVLDKARGTAVSVVHILYMHGKPTAVYSTTYFTIKMLYLHTQESGGMDNVLREHVEHDHIIARRMSKEYNKDPSEMHHNRGLRCNVNNITEYNIASQSIMQCSYAPHASRVAYM